MGSIGTNRKNFSYAEYAEKHKKSELYTEFKNRTGISISNTVLAGMSKEKLSQIMQIVQQQQTAFKKDFGFTPIDHIESESRSRAYASADWYSGTKIFGMRINVKRVNNNLAYFEEATAHEFGHLAVARLAYNTLSYHDARDALYYRFNSDKSSYNKAYTGWNTPFAKDILVKGLSKANNSMYMQLINKGSTEQAAITSVMGAHISEYATASYHEAIAECVAREMTGKGNTTSKAVVTELQSRCRKIR